MSVFYQNYIKQSRVNKGMMLSERKNMSVEGGSIGGGTGGSIAGVGVAASLGPSGGEGFSSFGIGAEMTSLSSPIINEGTVAGFKLKETMPYTIDSNQIDEIVTEPRAPLVIRQAESIADAALQSEQPFIEVYSDALSTSKPDILQPNRSLYGEKIAQQAALMMVVARTALLPLALGNPAVVTQYQVASPNIEVAEEPEETELEEGVYEEDEPEQEKIETFIKPFGLEVDQQALAVRESELEEAIDLVASNKAGKEENVIEGQEFVDVLPAEHSGNRSQTLNEEGRDKNVLDGSRERVKQEISSQTFFSKAKARFVSLAINKKYRPEKRGNGNDITPEEHQLIHINHGHLQKHPFHIQKERIARKGITLVKVEKQKEKPIQSLPQLAEALKAA